MPLFEVDCSDIAGIIEESLKVENGLKTISSIFLNERYLEKIDYAPYFQRNYVWDKAKASYFIESILLGTEIPPLVLFADGGKLEVIDGRQRFETILNYINDEFALCSEGLHTLTGLKGLKYSELEEDMRDKFADSKIRILQFSVVNEPSMTACQKDKIKKEIFNRYNSGIVPLKQPEIERAEYNDNPISCAIESKLNEDQLFFSRSEELFTAPRARKGEKRDRTNALLSHIRNLLTMPYVPIRSYAYGKNKTGIVKVFFDDSYNRANPVDVISNYEECLGCTEKLICQLRSLNSEYADNLLLHQVFFWGFYIARKKGVAIEDLTYPQLATLIRDADSNASLWGEVAEDYRCLERVFSQTGSHYDKAIFGRYMLCANCLGAVLPIDYSSHLRNPELFSNVMNGRDARRQFEQYRISKADPHTESVYDILVNIGKNRFEIRPRYQRSEVTDPSRASYLMESIMLDIRIPPIFVCKRIDGVSEVVDGQQRLLSIIGFLGKPYKNENGEVVYSKKNKFKLKGLRILSDFNGMDVDGISETKPDVIDHILDFGIEVIEIDMERNEDFSALDLFLRLNQKPFPIKPNSFELWNSYLDRKVIEKAKTIVKSHPGALFKTDNTRMLNEELVMTLGYIAYQSKMRECSGRDMFDVFVRDGKMTARIRDKKNVTEILDRASRSDKEGFLQALDSVDLFLRKLEALTGDGFRELRALWSTAKGQTRVTNKNVYLLWILLACLDEKRIRASKENLRKTIRDFFAESQELKRDADVDALLDKWCNEVLCCPCRG